MNKSFKAIIADQQNNKYEALLKTLTVNDLPDRDTLIQVDYSSLNYKDALAVSGKGKICRSLPMVCGIDLAGRIEESSNKQWSKGDSIIVNGYGMSETNWGGYSQYQRVSSEWLIRLPENMDFKMAMSLGTAGYTAMLCVQAIQDHGIKPDDGPIVVTGASGGVGSVALMILTKLGYQSVAVSGRESTHEYLLSLGASKVISRDELGRESRPLEKELWAGGIDSVGSTTLATMLAQTQYDGIVAACGLAGGHNLPSTVMPFILRGVTLKGIDSVMASMSKRQRAWDQLAQLFTSDELDIISSVKPMNELPKLADDLLTGKLKGRIVIDVNADG